MRVALIAPARCFRAAPLWLTAKLLLADEGERGAEPGSCSSWASSVCP
jgi:hypothetical protein